MVMNTKKNYRLDLNEELTAEADRMFDRLGMSRTDGVTRLLVWFVTAPPELKAAISNNFPLEMDAEQEQALLEHIRAASDRLREDLETPWESLPIDRLHDQLQRRAAPKSRPGGRSR